MTHTRTMTIAALILSVGGCAAEPAPRADEGPHEGAATLDSPRPGPPDRSALRARLLDRSSANPAPQTIREEDAERLIDALEALGRARAALRRGEIARADADAAHAALSRLCPEISGLSCDALLFTPRSAR